MTSASGMGKVWDDICELCHGILRDLLICKVWVVILGVTSIRAWSSWSVTGRGTERVLLTGRVSTGATVEFLWRA